MGNETVKRFLNEEISKKMKENNCGEGLQVLWELIGSKIVYWNPIEKQPDYDRCDLVFYKDPIALPLLKRIASLAVNDKEVVYVHQIAPISSYQEHEKFLWQFIRFHNDIEFLEGDEFRVIIDKTKNDSNCIALWIYDLKDDFKEENN